MGGTKRQMAHMVSGEKGNKDELNVQQIGVVMATRYQWV